MFTQLFGSYLLNNNYLDSDQLSTCLKAQSLAHAKIGVLAINSGLMNFTQVEEINLLQQSVDKKFGELAIERGYLTEITLDDLLNTQKTDFLLLSQSLLDKGYLNLEQLSKAILGYKADYDLSDSDFNLLSKEDVVTLVNSFKEINDLKRSKDYKEYLVLFLNNVIRFVSSDFLVKSIRPATEFKSLECVSQKISGGVILSTFVSAGAVPFTRFAEIFSEEKLDSVDDFTKACVGEFLNQVNGIYTVNKSCDGLDLSLSPQFNETSGCLSLIRESMLVELEFTFGIVNLVIS